MKQIDNRQKKQIQMRAASVPAHRSHNTYEPHAPAASRKANSDTRPLPGEPVHAGPKIGRNDACPCGSGLKYKKCCLLKL